MRARSLPAPRSTLHALAACALLLLAACAAPRPTAKIALVAPFEGRLRDVGYQAFPAFRLALREQIAAGGIGRYQVEFVAYNDDGDAESAQRVARNVVSDPDVVAVIGHYRMDTTLAALSVYTAAGLPVLVPGVTADLLPADDLVFRMGPSSAAGEAAMARASTRVDCHTSPALAALTMDALRTVPDLQSEAMDDLYGSRTAGLCFVADAPYPADLPAAERALAGFAEVSGGAGPGPRSISAYDATRVLLDAISLDVEVHGKPTRAGVADALRRISTDGVLGSIRFDANGRWADAPVWVYRFDDAGVARLAQAP